MAQAKIYWDRENYQAVEKVNFVFLKPIFFVDVPILYSQKTFSCF